MGEGEGGGDIHPPSPELEIKISLLFVIWCFHGKFGKFPMYLCPSKRRFARSFRKKMVRKLTND